MNHTTQITVDGYSWFAVATVAATEKGREVTRVSCDNVPTRVLGTLSEHLVDVNDVLELVRVHLNDTAIAKRELKCGDIEISWYPLNASLLREDLTGPLYRVKLTDTAGGAHEYELGACNSFAALKACTEALGVPVRSSVVQPINL